MYRHPERINTIALSNIMNAMSKHHTSDNELDRFMDCVATVEDECNTYRVVLDTEMARMVHIPSVLLDGILITIDHGISVLRFKKVLP